MVWICLYMSLCVLGNIHNIISSFLLVQMATQLKNHHTLYFYSSCSVYMFITLVVPDHYCHYKLWVCCCCLLEGLSVLQRLEHNALTELFPVTPPLDESINTASSAVRGEHNNTKPQRNTDYSRGTAYTAKSISLLMIFQLFSSNNI